MTGRRDLALLRLVAQQIAGPPAPSAADAVRGLLAVQGQDYPGVLLSIALRSTRARSDVEAALDSGSVVRSWPMRGTLHLVAAEDLPWMLELLGPRVLSGVAARWDRLGLTEEVAEQARELAADALAGGGKLRREELLAAFGDGGVDVSGQRGYHLLWYLSQTGTLCLGPTDGTQQLFVLLDEWVPAARRRGFADRGEALGELARRFFSGHGPATVKDLARWAGLPLGDVRAGLALARPALTSVTVDDVEYFLAPGTADALAACRSRARGVFLLPGFDEFVLGYADRSVVLDPAFADRIVPGNNGMFRPTVVDGGRIVGTWGWAGRGTRRTVTATPFTSFPARVERALPRLAEGLV